MTRAQIAAAAQRRAAGDWSGACAVAGIGSEVDLPAVAREAGAEVAAAVEDDLRHLVPDLLRWHVLRLQYHSARVDWRFGVATFHTRHVVPLSEHGERALYLAAHGHGGPFSVRSASAAGPSRFVLRFGAPPGSARPMSLAGLRELWDARETPGLLARCGGRTRLPFFAPDGARQEGTGPEAVTERAWRLFEAGRPEDALREAGIDLDLDDSAQGWHFTVGPSLQPAAATLASAARRAAARAGVPAVWSRGGRNRILWLDRLDVPDRPRLRIVDAVRAQHEPAVELPLTEVFWPEDFRDLVDGRIAPSGLHPLVAAALFPSLPPDDVTGPAPMAVPGPTRVRCDGAWHVAEFRDGVLTGPHSPAELDREKAMLALGGPPPVGCAGAHVAWRGGPSRPPRVFNAVRRELMRRAGAGEADTVEAMLDAGVDPHCRDGDGRTLLHLLACLVPDEAALRLLPRLLAAGLDPRTEDRHGQTPAAVAERAGAHPSLVAALRV
ncbi:hypothetical protein GCM10022255_097310 [Dactylosporangium darangshiense]|uniref:Ankyrin repeat domain-containing protein n=1 Tax=Dactylosporangium darangshiense TaxID=579108 RepID=A0ABP8DRH9_9ACTN